MQRLKVSKMQLIQGAMMILPGAILWVVMNPSKPTEEELRKTLASNPKYREITAQSQAQRQAMVDHFRKTAHGDPELDDKMKQLLHAGKSKVTHSSTYDRTYAKDAEDPPAPKGGP